MRSLAPAMPNDSFDLKLINQLKENRDVYFDFLRQSKKEKEVKKEEPKKQSTDNILGDFGTTEIGEFDDDLEGFFL